MIARELEVCLHQAFVEARGKRHTVITLEHLLLGLLESPVACEVLATNGTDIDGLRARVARYVATHAARNGHDYDTQPNMEFQRAIQDAILRAQRSGKQEVTSADVLSAIVEQK